jgi:hypothetical protein
VTRRLLAVLLLALVGPLAARAQAVEPFDAIEISGSAQVRFEQGDADRVTVEGDEDAQRAVSLEVRGGTLAIRNAGSWMFWREGRARVNVTARTLRRVTISGAADFVAPGALRTGALRVDISGAGLARFDRLQADELAFSISGSGEGQAAGTLDLLRVSISGKGDFRGENLHAQRARVSVSGLGDVKVWATRELSLAVSGVGTVDYWGAPSVRRSTSGLATVNDRGAKPGP